MDDRFDERLLAELADLRAAGLYKEERAIVSPQGAKIRVAGGEVLNFCANNYLGLAGHPAVAQAAHEGLDRYGFGMASVRFICGTQDQHQTLERRLAAFLRCEAAISYVAAFDANGGVFEPLLGPDDVIISDALNHASIIDGIRLCKAHRLRYDNVDMGQLQRSLEESSGARTRLIATDGVFSMDGTIAPLADICELADRHRAIVMVDDCHATGFLGATGRGTPEHCGVEGRVDILTGTLGKALGGASGGYVASRQPIVDLLRQRSRPYLFSNTIAPPLIAASLKVLDLLDASSSLRERLFANTRRFREGMTAAGFGIRPGVHPIVPVMLGDARLAQAMAKDLLAEGIYVIGFSFPVVPKGQARIRVQLSAAHEPAHVDQAIAAFTAVGRRHGVVK